MNFDWLRGSSVAVAESPLPRGGKRFERWLSVPTFSRFTIAARITAIALTLAVPLNLIIFAVIWHLSEAASETQRIGLLYTARSVAAAVDAKLGEYVTLTQALARSPAVLEDKLDAFEAEARRAFATPDAMVMVANLEGRQLMNTSGQPGQLLPVRGPEPLVTQKRAFETRSTVITGVRLGLVSKDWLITVETPIFKDGQPFRVLSSAVRTHSFFRLLNDQLIPNGWLACIIDQHGRFIARVPGYDRNVGQLAPQGLQKVEDRGGIFEFLSAEGDPIVVAIAHSAGNAWRVAMAIKKAEIQKATWYAIRWAAILGGGFSILSLLFASAIARSITGPIGDLRHKTATLLDEPAPSMPSRGPPEVRDLSEALQQSAARRDRSEQALRESEEKLRLALDAAELGIWRWDAGESNNVMQWDSRCRALFGVPSDSCVTFKTWVNCIVPEDRAQAKASVARSIDPSDPHDETACEYRVQHPDGTMLWLSSTGRAFFEPDPGSPSGRRVTFKAGAVRDVTHVHLADAALRESEERLRLSNEAAGIGTFTIDPATGCVHYSPELAAMLGFPRVSTARIEDAFARVHRDDLRGFEAKYQEGLSGAEGGQIRMDFRFVRPGGEVRWMTWASRVHFRERPSGRIPVRIDGACVDITERKYAEEALRHSEARFRGIFEYADTGIAIIDMEHRFESCNPAYSEMLGYSEQELRQLAFLTHVHPDDREANAAQCKQLLAQERSSFEIFNRHVRKDGTSIWVEISLLRDAAGRPSNILTLATDVTQRKRQEDQIRLLMREVNHRSKNLLTVVLAIARQTTAANLDDFLSRFEDRVQALAANQDLLIKNEWRGVNFDELVRFQLAHFEDLIGTRIALEGPPLLVSARAAQAIGMVLHELATNAGKYGALAGSEGRVEIEWRVEGATAAQTFMMSWREVGVRPVAAPSKRGFGSTVIREMAEMSLDAKVELDFPATGLTWRLRCAAGQLLKESNSTPVDADENLSVSAPAIDGYPRILVVEDEAVVALEIAQVLLKAGFKVVGPARAADQALRLINETRCDAAILDINLGGETSEPVALRLRERNTPFVTVSGYSSQQVPPVFKGSCSLTKPLRPELLVAELKKCIAQRDTGSLEPAELSAK
jgi:PAS domain S-box-containing protein